MTCCAPGTRPGAEPTPRTASGLWNFQGLFKTVPYLHLPVRSLAWRSVVLLLDGVVIVEGYWRPRPYGPYIKGDTHRQLDSCFYRKPRKGRGGLKVGVEGGRIDKPALIICPADYANQEYKTGSPIFVSGL